MTGPAPETGGDAMSLFDLTPLILGVRMSQWPTDELLWLTWHAVSHLTDEEKRRILARARREGLIPPRKQGA